MATAWAVSQAQLRTATGETYYLKAYVTNKVGIGYGEEINFSTLAIKPTLTTNIVTDITHTQQKVEVILPTMVDYYNGSWCMLEPITKS